LTLPRGSFLSLPSVRVLAARFVLLPPLIVALPRLLFLSATSLLRLFLRFLPPSQCIEDELPHCFQRRGNELHDCLQRNLQDKGQPAKRR
jgi:hypothetical protein